MTTQRQIVSLTAKEANCLASGLADCDAALLGGRAMAQRQIAGQSAQHPH